MKWMMMLSGICTLVYFCFPFVKWSKIWFLPLYFLGFFLLITLVYFLFLVLMSLTVSMKKEYEKPSPLYHHLFILGYRFLCYGAGVKIHASGVEKVPSDRRFLFISNHLSRFDTMVQCTVLPNTMMAFISKPSNFRAPIGRRYMKRDLYMAIDRDHPRRALPTINHAADLIKRDVTSVAVYPEGHRGKDYTLQPFHNGCLKIATKADCPIVVTTICGTEKIHRNYPWRRTDVYFDVIGVVEPEQRTTAEIGKEIREMMQKNLDRYREVK